MKRIFITAESFLPKESLLLNRLFAEGMETVHLRKPDASANELAVLLEGIEKAYHSRIVLHDHFDLLTRFAVKGVHLNRRNPQAPEQEGISVSRSCHSLEELRSIEAYDYVFLSPIFNSISKEGYDSRFPEAVLWEAKEKGLIHNKVYALGGITPEAIPLAARYGFGGVAVLGALWGDYLQTQDINAIIKRYERLTIYNTSD